MSQFTLSAEVRHDLGKGASRRLRRENKQVAAIIYGGSKTPQPITLEKSAFYKAIEDEAFFSSVITIDLEGKPEQVIIRDIQRHPYKALVTHADFMRVDATHEITMNVPLHINGEEACKGVKDEDGVLHVLANDVEISCLPGKLPEYLEVDVTNLGLGETLHLSDLPLPDGVSLVALSHGEEHDFGVVSVTRADTGTEGDEEGDEEATDEDGEKSE
ncbi:LSU ribosomal protein L25P [Chromohalobacter marismortui]|uniref:Large ribosomal subunit protein bL25 n=1 Tax=Chromohalobacter marismortui TaxID=42055 RepID=A0A4R7NUY7_9GAMM|nr:MULTISPECIES: 50S ribosomal protein L25/general stress protein Ctc [Chromohalobacter]MCI0510450.1 50S ribosomal protein L25/general stress protein Ctc [Chromohalobacter sp.]MCI0594197.1 50S ribosomal protein L25/general stress protein Ctc [Chromohalobacter sp.]TDU24974.1 LSU ribosomal protein L25P [Chromohalobacter marismortui]